MNGERGTGGESARVAVATALGGFIVEAGERGVWAVTPVPARALAAAGGTPADDPAATGAAHAHARAAAAAIRRYAEGGRDGFDGALDPVGPAFHRAVWERVRAVPFGATVTYGAIAAALGRPGDAQAVGAAVAANRLALLVPCHRVVGADGSLRGFAWGLELKRRLLAHEGTRTPELFEEEVRS